jgi:two-component system sensor histidine kinase BaeS
LRTLRARLLLSHILPLMVILPIVGFALTYLLETQVLLAEVSNELERQATFVASLVASYPQVWVDPATSREFVARVGASLSAHMTLYDTDGTLLASTNAADEALIGEKQDVPGLSQVLATGSAVRVEHGQRKGTAAAEVLVPVTIGRRIVGVIRLSDPLGGVYERFPRTRTFIIWVLASGLVVGVAAGWFLAIDLERPLRRSALAISAMADGEPLVTLPEQGPKEIRLLQRAFNTLATKLQSLEKGRRRLLANLVHELGRPLGALLSATQALAHGAQDDPTMRAELLAGMESEIQRTERLLDDLTRLYDQSVGALEIDPRPTPLRAWLVEVLSPWREAAQMKGLNWEVSLQADLPDAEIDADRMAQAIGNLVSNAIKYTPAGGWVQVSAGGDGREVWMRVRDTGVGIPIEEQGRVFAPHYRSPGRRRFPQGMGLGLSIANDLVTAHGGRIELQSTVGAGSVFTVRLPAGPRTSSDPPQSALP